MATLISVVKDAQWIDLSPNHKELREYLENSIQKVCVENKPDKVIMVKGAFGIGKTNTLHYLFHYGWCKLKVPVLFVSLEKLFPILEKYALEQPTKKIGNVELCELLDKKVKSAIDAIITNVPNEESKLFFFDWKDGNLTDFCLSFNPLQFKKIDTEQEDKFVDEKFEKLTSEVVLEVISSGHRPLLLIDEFETKFAQLKSIIDASNGGELRELFDQVVENKVSFNLIIGNGPASGYELKSDNSAKGSDDAESSRIAPKQVPFPLPETTKIFLGTESKGLLNFAWWASRCRARHFLRLKEAVGSLEKLTTKKSYSEFLSEFTFFSDPIESSEEGSSPITYVKTDFFGDFSEELKDEFLPKLISEIKPINISFDNNRDYILKSKKFLFCSPNVINISQKLMPTLAKDVNEGILKPFKEKDIYLELDYDLTIRKYFDFFLRSIANEENNIAFGMVDDVAADQSFCELFLLPLIHLSYDFITQYEEESIARNKQAAEFLLNMLTNIKNKSEKKEIRSLFPATYALFKKNDYLDGEGFIQLSLSAIRETFEQPIGEPKLNYKNTDLESKIQSVQINNTTPVLKHSKDDVDLYFIPNLPTAQLTDYINVLKRHFTNNVLKHNHDNGKNISTFIYFDEHNDTIDNFKDFVLYEHNDINTPRAGHSLNKLNFESIKSQALNFPSQTSDFLDSTLKIGLVGIRNNELSILISKIENGCLEIKEIVNVIKQPTWTERKETRRTIEHFEKVVFTNEESELVKMTKRAKQNYDDKLLEVIPQKSTLSRSLMKYCINEDLYSGTDVEYGSFTKKVINLFLYEHNEIPNGLLDLLKEANDFKIGAKTEEQNSKLNFWEFKSFIQSHGSILNKHKENFNTEDSVIQSLSDLSKILLENNKPQTITEYCKYLAYSEHFIRTYTNQISVYASVPLIETIYNHNFSVLIDKSIKKNEIIQQLAQRKQQITNLRTTIGQSTDELKEILKRDEAPFEYSTKLGDFSAKILIGIEKLLETDDSISILIVCTEILGYADYIVNAANEFNTQISKLKNTLQTKYNIINGIQEKTESLYSDSLNANVLVKVKKIEKPNYWGKILLPTIKAIEKYNSIFKNREDYSPKNKRKFEPSEIDTFIQQVNTKFEEKKKSIDETQQTIDSAVEEIKELLVLENELKELLKTKE
jgi:hypothetical protein